MKLFHSARLQLTIWYLLVIALISLTFSAAIYKTQTDELTRFSLLQRQRIEQRLEQGFGMGPGAGLILVDLELISETKKRILVSLLVFNGIVISFSGIFGYFLAGKTLEPIEEMVQEQTRFIADASHELRTPITSLLVNLEVFMRGKKTRDESLKVIDASLIEVRRLRDLAGSLLHLSADLGHASQREKLDLKKIVESVVRKYQATAKERKITLKQSGVSVFATGNKNDLEELFTILLDNAIKYSKEGGEVTLATKSQNKKTIVTVKDTGVGIAKTDLPHIFDRFYRADLSRSKGHSSGYGLGLSIAQKIADSHRAEIAVKSKLGSGSTFVVSFPKQA